MTEPADVAADLRARALAALHEVIDPEVGLDVVELGLVYALEVDGPRIRVELTMTTAACPLGEQIALDAERRLAAMEGVAGVDVQLVWEPPWTPDHMSARARDELGWTA